MYSPTTRLLTVLELLQSYKQMSGSEIARRLEVDKRTVRRYITMLQDMGIPVEGERGPYGAYQLGRGYKLPPLMYTDEEAVAIALGLIIMRAYRLPVEVAAVEGALAKTERVLPDKLFQQVRGLQQAIHFNVTLPPPFRNTDVVAVLSLAIQQHHQVRMRYQAYNGNESERDFDPYGIVFNEGIWYTSGYCHLREDLRVFRLDRVLEVDPGKHTFKPPKDFNVMEHVLHSVAMLTGEAQIEVLFETSLENAQFFTHRLMGVLEPTPDGILFRRSASQMHWIAHMLLTANFPLKIIKTDALRDTLCDLGNRAHQIADQV